MYPSQLKLLSDLSADVARGLFLSAIGVPLISPAVRIGHSALAVVTGTFFIYLSLKFLELKEVIEA